MQKNVPEKCIFFYSQRQINVLDVKCVKPLLNLTIVRCDWIGVFVLGEGMRIITQKINYFVFYEFHFSIDKDQ